MLFRYSILCLSLLFLVSLSYGQGVLPKDPSTGKILFSGVKPIDEKSKKKIMIAMNEWVSKVLVYPPMVFSVIEVSKDTLMVKAISEVPSLNDLHPISFRLILVPQKRSFWYSASGFYFEDIKLSLDTWLKKYSESTNPRNIRNIEIVSKGLDSHIFMSMNQLVEVFNKK